MTQSASVVLRRAVGAIAGARFRKRALAVVTFSINNLLLPFLTPVVSFLVVRLASVELWGEFIHVMIVVQLGTHVVVWGNKDYLLREFSRNPATIARTWQASLVTRLALFAGLSLLAFGLGFTPHRSALIVLWGLGLVLDQSFDTLILYRRDFVFSMVVDLGGLALMTASILALGPRLDLDTLIALFAAANLAQAAGLIVRYRSLFRSWSGRFDARYFSRASMFFALGLSGLLQSRIDLYSVNAFLPRSDVGRYHVFSNFVLYIQSFAAFMLLPFAAGLYRLAYRAILRLSIRLLAMGALLIGPALLAIYFLVTHVYHFDLPPVCWVLSIALVLPIYAYSPIIHALFKAGRQSTVVKVGLLGAALNLALNLAWTPRLGIIGALMAAAAAQLIALGAYLLQIRSLEGRDTPALSGLPFVDGS